MPRVSVVIPAFNRAHLIGRAIQSVLAQSMSHLEVIVVDDGSTDGTARLVQKLAREDWRIRCLAYRENLGAQAARNVGIRAARSQWVAFLDSDDEWLADSLEQRLARAEGTGAAVVHSACQVRYQDGHVTDLSVPPVEGKVYRAVLARPGPVFPALLVKRDALYRIGLLDTSLASWHEWDTAIRLARYFRFAYAPHTTFLYHRDHDATISADVGRNAEGYQQVIRKHGLAILTRCGPGALARHFGVLAATYEKAGDAAAAQRCRRAARLGGPLFPQRLARALRRPVRAAR